MNNVFTVQMINMKQNELVTENYDGSYTIFISDSLSPEAKKEAYDHALYHIEHDDFHSGNVQKAEKHCRKRDVIPEPKIDIDLYEERKKHAEERHIQAHKALLKYQKSMRWKDKFM